jgi:hypothetical protein
MLSIYTNLDDKTLFWNQHIIKNQIRVSISLVEVAFLLTYTTLAQITEGKSNTPNNF